MDSYEKHLEELNETRHTVDGLYIGSVLANNDPHQMGRCRVQIHGIDEAGQAIEKYRWVPSMSAFSGVQIDALMGANKDTSTGFSSYGSFGVHKIGAVVVVQFIGGHISNPIIMGVLPPNDMISGLPAGNKAQNETTDAPPQDILPTKTNLDTAFGSSDSDVKSTRGYEVTGRAAGERTGIPDVIKENLKDGDAKADREKSGYPKSINTVPQEGAENEPMMYSFTTPNQHTVLMNDDPDNCRVRIRTVGGNQVILDDTNERIYISTQDGANFIEMDADGHIDIFAKSRISIHSETDINLKADKQVNIEGIEGVNIVSTKDIKLSTDASTNIKSGKSAYIDSGEDVHIKSGGDTNIGAGGGVSAKGGGDVVLDAGGDIGAKAGGNLVGKGSQVQFNGPPPASSTAAKPAIPANPVNRNPNHESDDWRSIDPKGKRSDAVNPAHDDQAITKPYESDKEGGLKSRKRSENWRK